MTCRPSRPSRATVRRSPCQQRQATFPLRTSGRRTHAFAGSDRGEIELGFHQEGAGWRLWVHDNGRGLTQNAEGTGFGRQLLFALAARVNAEVRSETDGGTRVEVYSGLPK